MKRFAILVAGALALAPVLPANAQTINADAIRAACSGGGFACSQVVAAQVAALRAAGITGPALDAQLTQIATVVQESAAASPAARTNAAATLREIAVQIESPAASAAVIEAAVVVETAVDVPAPIPTPAPITGSPA